LDLIHRNEGKFTQTQKYLDGFQTVAIRIRGARNRDEAALGAKLSAKAQSPSKNRVWCVGEECPSQVLKI
jgi:hypothetical protein